MSAGPRVRSFAPSEWPLYRDLRLRSLEDAPDQFARTLADERTLPDTHWASRLAQGVESSLDLPLLAEVDGDPVGLAWGRVDRINPETVNLYGLWVAPDFRSRGIGRLLLRTVIGWAKHADALQVILEVTCGESPAARLYARAGFEAFAHPRPLRSGSDLLSQRLRLPLAGVL